MVSILETLALGMEEKEKVFVRVKGSRFKFNDLWLGRQYVARKSFSMFRRIGDFINHARIFPQDSLRFFPRIMWNGVRSAVKGEWNSTFQG